MAALTKAGKCLRAVAKGWRRLNGSELLAKAIEGVVFVDGEEAKAVA